MRKPRKREEKISGHGYTFMARQINMPNTRYAAWLINSMKIQIDLTPAQLEHKYPGKYFGM